MILLLRRSAIAFNSAAIALCLLGTACGGRQTIDTQRLPDGTVRLVCRAPLQNCLSHADLICRNGPYDVLRARDQRDRYGPEFGTAQTEVRTSEAVIRCAAIGDPRPDDPAVLAAPASTPTTSPALGTAPAAEPARKNVCVPGATQACIGPGACEGGQSCLPDSSGFGPCDCGTIGAPVTAPGPLSPGSKDSKDDSGQPGAPSAPTPAPATPPPAKKPGSPPAPPPTPTRP